MRRLSSMVLALAMVLSITLPSRAELFKNFKTEGSLELLTMGVNNGTDRNSAADDYRSEMQTRVMLGGTWDLLDDVHAKLLLRKNNRLYGNSGESTQDVQDNVFLDNAYAKIDKVFGHVDVTFGRQFYGQGDDLVIYFGPNADDLLSVNSLDTFRVDSDIMNVAKVTGIFAKRNEVGTINPTPTDINANADTDIYGAEVGTDKVIPKGNLAAYYYVQNQKNGGSTTTPTNGNNTLNVYGLRAKGDVPVLTGLTYQAEGIANGGRNATTNVAPGDNQGYTGSAYLLGLNYVKELNSMPVRASGEYGRGTDNFQAINAGKRFGIIWGQQSTYGPSTLNRNSSTGLNNLKVFDLGVGVNPLPKLGVDVAYYNFNYDAYTTNTALSAGQEWDLTLSWKHSENVLLDVKAASFQEGQALKNGGGTPTNPITYIGSDIKIKF
jgi:hypothetical protein